MKFKISEPQEIRIARLENEVIALNKLLVETREYLIETRNFLLAHIQAGPGEC
jgi:hypothetical protein